ncbi:unnamed protein product [Moneuplotes crassus]|uniref:non-specific serine/threonine protein kinase n=1 Tax=Euplotes crassus TaxID=5936 RepID=A0AAD1X2A3_EUPCR|nr:unnamed protein product [Moneuplotes crassus]
MRKERIWSLKDTEMYIEEIRLLLMVYKIKDSFKLKKELFIYQRTGSVYEFYEFTGKVLGEGGFGQVHEVKEKDTGRLLACKQIPRSKIRNQMRFINEVLALKNCDHPNIVKLYEVFEEEHDVFLIQEKLNGGELFDYITNRDYLTEAEAAKIFSQIIKSLIYCHKMKLTHRDLKPENFMFKSSKPNSTLKLIDFGYARIFQKEPNDGKAKILRMRSKVGTENFMAPEMILRNYSSSCDIWAAGVILYIMLCGFYPFEGEDEEETFRLIENIEYDFDDEVFDSISDEAKDLISKILTPEKDRITLEQVLEHPWIIKNLEEPDDGAINTNLIDRLKKFSKSTKLRKAVATLIATQVTDRSVFESTNAFNKIDTNKDGYITLDELERGMASHPTQVKHIMDQVDTDKNEKINYNEFIAATLKDKTLKNCFSINKAFDFFDKNKDGQIDKDELQEILQDSDIDRVETNIIKGILLECDVNNDGVIDKKEFFRCMSLKRQDP